MIITLAKQELCYRRENRMHFQSIPTYVIMVPEHHRQTDRQTDRQTETAYCGITAEPYNQQCAVTRVKQSNMTD